MQIIRGLFLAIFDDLGERHFGRRFHVASPLATELMQKRCESQMPIETRPNFGDTIYWCRVLQRAQQSTADIFEYGISLCSVIRSAKNSAICKERQEIYPRSD